MKTDKNKIIFISVIGVVILFMVVYSIMAFSGTDEQTQNTMQSPFVPELDEEVEAYNSRLEAVDDSKEIKIRNAPSMYDEKKLNSQGIYDKDNERKKKQRMIDSIYSNGQMNYKQQSNSAPPREDWKSVRNRINSEIKDSHKDFFNAATIKPQTGETETNAQTDPVIHAEVNGDQKVMQNGRVQMRLTKPHIINGLLYPVNTYIYGFVTFGPNRCFITINHVDQLPVQLTVFDYEDGGQGLFVINSFKEDASGVVLDQAITDIQLPAGLPRISGLKNLFRRSNRKVKVTVVNKYQVLIKPLPRQ